MHLLGSLERMTDPRDHSGILPMALSLNTANTYLDPTIGVIGTGGCGLVEMNGRWTGLFGLRATGEITRCM